MHTNFDTNDKLFDYKLAKHILNRKLVGRAMHKHSFQIYLDSKVCIDLRLTNVI